MQSWKRKETYYSIGKIFIEEYQLYTFKKFIFDNTTQAQLSEIHIQTTICNDPQKLFELQGFALFFLHVLNKILP